MTLSRTLLILAIITILSLFFSFDLQHYLTLTTLKSQQSAILTYWQSSPLETIAIYSLIYIAVTGLSLPGATVLTLAGGMIFGLLWGTVIVSFTSTIGATLAFLASRFLFRESIKNRFSDSFKTVDDGIEKEGAFYLFSLRLIPIFPFFAINLTMGLTKIKTRTFYWVSQLGMLAGTLVYVNAGTQLGKITSLSEIFSVKLFASFALLGLFPLVAKLCLNRYKNAKKFNQWNKPRHFDNNIVVIGAGSAGLVTSLIASTVKAKVTLIEKHKMGGDCLNTGCVPSKALIRSAKFLSHSRRATEFGIEKSSVDFNFSDVMDRIQNIIKTIEPHDSIERYTKMGVNVITGSAKIVSPWEIEVNCGNYTQTLSSRSIVIAAGAKPFIPAIPGLETLNYFTSDNIWNLRNKPERLLILGGGPIGCELTQAFSRLGCKVTQIEKSDRLMTREDTDVSQLIMDKFRYEGINLLLNHNAQQFILENGEKILVAKNKDKRIKIPFDEVLIALGRAANISGYGVEEMGIELSPRKTIAINDFQETNYPNIYACGDVSGPYQFTHTAAHQAWYAAVNALFGSVFKKFRTDYSVIPWATFVDPEVARVGLNEQLAKDKNIAYEVSTYDMGDLDRAIADNETRGFVKILTPPGKDKILGVTLVGEHAGDLIAEFVLAMKHNIGLNKILATIHIYPTMAEANKFAAGAWKRKHAPKKILDWVERFHRWRRQ